MISRLLELRLTAFRAFREEQIIPLDADLILIYGPNGAAKTSLLSGLEFALTGQVNDLYAFSDDYPRCLKHLGAISDPTATIRFRDEAGELRKIVHAVDGESCKLLSQDSLTLDGKRFYLDRCYLSQSSLSRLLENYQASGKEQAEQPLVRFVRELLGLDLLENLTAGLHDVGDIRRIERSVPTLREAREKEARAQQQIAEIDTRRRTLAEAWQSAIVTLKQIAGEIGDPEPTAAWDLSGIEARLEEMAKVDRDQATTERLNRLRRSQGRLQSSLGLLESGDDSSLRANIQLQLNQAEATCEGIKKSLEDLLARVRYQLRASEFRLPEGDNLIADFQSAKEILTHAHAKIEAGARRIAEMNAEAVKLRTRSGEITTILEGVAPSGTHQIASQQRLARTLATLVQHVHGEECPVCGRDFSELRAGPLAERIEREIIALGENIQALEQLEHTRITFESERGDISYRLATLEQSLFQEQSLLERYAVQGPQIVSLLEECIAAEPNWRWLSSLYASIAGFQSKLDVLETRRQQRASALENLTKLANELGVSTSPQDPAEHVSALIAAHLTPAVELVERKLAGAIRLHNALSDARSARLALDKIDAESTDAHRLRDQATTLIQKMRELIQEGKDLSKAATSAKKKLLDQVFNTTLNRLWGDLFRRLAKNERFHPQLGEPRTERGQIRTTIEGCPPFGTPFVQFASVASSGNVCTAALSLFLALHLIEQPRHRVLVLDDPVQNMDDVHIVQLAGLLRKVARSAQRQIIVAVHERALFDYLCLELSPTVPKGRLLTLELQRSRSDEAPTLITTEHEWKGDQLRFGVAK